MSISKYYINVVIPIDLNQLFTYYIDQCEIPLIRVGCRVVVPFGKNKMYTALVYSISQVPALGYQTKKIFQILDKLPIVSEKQLKLWEFIKSYYMSSLGSVFKLAVPSLFILESETLIEKKSNFTNYQILNDKELLIIQAFNSHSHLTLKQASEIINQKKIISIVEALIDKNAITIKDKVYQKYKPKIIKYVRISKNWVNKKKLHELLEILKRSEKQRQVVMMYFSLNASNKKPIKVKELEKASGCSSFVLSTLVKKEILEYYHLQTDRVSFEGKAQPLKKLNLYQNKALSEIKDKLYEKNIILFQGVSGSGKTEIYTHLIKEQLEKDKQVLFLVPEIALTTQLIFRVQQYFGNFLSVYHSKYSLQERTEVWNNILENKPKARLILGVRSSVLLPFDNLGLIIVDESHDSTYKQQNIAPLYNARDIGITLAKLHQAKVILGSATPSLESFYNVEQKKYEYVNLDIPYHQGLLPDIKIVDIRDKRKRKLMTGHFSDILIEEIRLTLKEKKQIIIFQNKRGYAPIIECEDCGSVPLCPNCDVSLTFHKLRKEMKCHYCNYSQIVISNCLFCNSSKLDLKGIGTEQLEQKVSQLFPSSKVARIDKDSTQSKYAYQKIISSFEAKEIDILVGTQMLTKGLDFGDVSLVCVIQVDQMLHFPDFRSQERTFQVLVQAAGRAGRKGKRGKVLIQSYQPLHRILQQVSKYNYNQMYKEQLLERFQYNYPPYSRLIRITLKNINYQNVEDAANWFVMAMKKTFGNNVLGPTTPNIERIRNQYIRLIMLKIPLKQSLSKTKLALVRLKNIFLTAKSFRSVKLIIDVDPS